MSKRLAAAVTGNKTDGYDFTCPVNDGSCGDPAGGSSFTSTGWPERKFAEARGREHFDEHISATEGKPRAMSSLDDFRAKHGLEVDPERPNRAIVTAKDL